MSRNRSDEKGRGFGHSHDQQTEAERESTGGMAEQQADESGIPNEETNVQRGVGVSGQRGVGVSGQREEGGDSTTSATTLDDSAGDPHGEGVVIGSTAERGVGVSGQTPSDTSTGSSTSTPTMSGEEDSGS